jgi:hypothetical protein
MSASFEPDGTPPSVGEHPLTFRAICYFAFWLISSKPTNLATLIPEAFASSTVLGHRLMLGNLLLSSTSVGLV